MTTFTALARKTLTVGVARVAEKARQKAKWSSTIPGAISLTPVGESDGKLFISIEVAPEHADQFLAFEYGSGLHGEDKRRYKISPRPDGPGWLAFPISRWPNYVPPPYVNVAVFPGAISRKPYVMHPGVKARPMMEPAMQEEDPKLIQELAEIGLTLEKQEPRVVIIK